ncbi:hypothetical protein L1887_29209 [Cichorium endivia]|nr:hypothetical protein L1887_29209 [Cichorium endivia]
MTMEKAVVAVAGGENNRDKRGKEEVSRLEREEKRSRRGIGEGEVAGGGRGLQKKRTWQARQTARSQWKKCIGL